MVYNKIEKFSEYAENNNFDITINLVLIYKKHTNHLLNNCPIKIIVYTIVLMKTLSTTKFNCKQKIKKKGIINNSNNIITIKSNFLSKLIDYHYTKYLYD